MAFRFGDGFEIGRTANYMTRRWTTTATTFVFDTGRLHGNCLVQTNSALPITTPALPSGDVWIPVFGTYQRETARTLLEFLDGASTVNCFLRKIAPTGSAPDFRLELVRGSTIIATSADIRGAQWHFIQLKVTLHTSTSGAYECRVDGTTVFSGSGVRTAETTSVADRFRWTPGNTSTFTNANIGALDDFAVLDDAGSANNDFPGDINAEGIFPTGAGANTDWTPNTGSNFAAVDDPATGANPDDSATYVTAASTALVDTYAFGNLSFNTGRVLAAVAGLNARVVSSGSADLQVVFRNAGGSEGNSPSITVSNTSYASYISVMELSLVSASSWTISEINGGEFGFERVA